MFLCQCILHQPAVKSPLWFTCSPSSLGPRPELMGAGLKEKQKDRHKYFFPGTPRLGLWAVYLRVCSFPGALWWTQLGRDFATLGKRKHVIKRFFGGGVYFRRLKNKVRHLHGSDFKWLKRVCSGVFRPFPMTTQSPAPETTNIDSSLGILPKMIYTHVCKMYVVCVFFFLLFVSQWKHMIPLWEM